MHARVAMKAYAARAEVALVVLALEADVAEQAGEQRDAEEFPGLRVARGRLVGCGREAGVGSTFPSTGASVYISPGASRVRDVEVETVRVSFFCGATLGVTIR